MNYADVLNILGGYMPVYMLHTFIGCIKYLPLICLIVP